MSARKQTHRYDKETAKRKLPKPAAGDLDAVAQQQTPPSTIIQEARLDPGSLTAGNVLQLQRTIGNQLVGKVLAGRGRQREPIQRKEPETGLPPSLKAGIEKLSGLSMDDVQVQYKSDTPAGVRALAYTQGTDIHLSPGQEQHLPHEAWHVVQQKQGRVSPSIQGKGTNINMNSSLEEEADVMGAKASHVSIEDRLPSPSQVESSMRELGQPIQAAHRHSPGIPVRQFKCGSPKRGKTTEPVPAPDLNTIEGIAARMNLTPKQLRKIWSKEEPDPEEFRLYKEYGVDVVNQFPEIFERRLTAMVPPQITLNLRGNDDKKLAKIFQRINALDYVYTGGYKPPEVGFMSKSGDCKTLAEMFQLAASAAGIDGVEVEEDTEPRLVDARVAHGREGTSNEEGGKYWMFDSHFWCTYGGTSYDLLFKTTDELAYYSTTGEGIYRQCAYLTYEGDRYSIARNVLKSSLGIEIESQGIVFDSLQKLQEYVDEKLDR